MCVRVDGAQIAGLAWSPSGHRLASVSLDQSLIVWGDTKEFGVEPRFTVPRTFCPCVVCVLCLDACVCLWVGVLVVCEVCGVWSSKFLAYQC